MISFHNEGELVLLAFSVDMMGIPAVHKLVERTTGDGESYYAEAMST